LQSFLGVKADGVIGPLTRAAISNWQMKNQVSGTGIWDVATKAKYESGTAMSVPPPASTYTPPLNTLYTPPTYSTPPSIWPEATPPLIIPPKPVANTTSFLDKLKGNAPTVTLVAGGVILLGVGMWYFSRKPQGSMAGCNC
jgi:peptidoglycan hydrolase-like protein with peptidoglycan-binding domain